MRAEHQLEQLGGDLVVLGVRVVGGQRHRGVGPRLEALRLLGRAPGRRAGVLAGQPATQELADPATQDGVGQQATVDDRVDGAGAERGARGHATPSRGRSASRTSASWLP